MKQKLNWTLRFSSTALSALMAARKVSPWVLRIVDIELRRRPFADQFGVAAQIPLRHFQLGLVAGDGGLGLGDLCLQRARVQA